MSHDTPEPAPVTRPAGAGRHGPHWRRDVVELAALFTAVAVADTLAHLIGHGPQGAELLAMSAAALLATVAFHTWWAHRCRRRDRSTGPVPSTRFDARRSWSPVTAPGTSDGSAVSPASPVSLAAPPAPVSADLPGGPGAGVLWRLRTTVRDAPGSLAALCAALAGHGVDIRSLQTHPLAEGTVDEFLLSAPAGLDAAEIVRAADRAGGTGTRIERADAHDLVDVPTRVLGLATRAALDPAGLPLALRDLLGRCVVRSRPASPAAGTPEPDARQDVPGTVLRLRAPDGGTLTVERPGLPFTPAECARARALVDLGTRLGPRSPRAEEELGAVRVERAVPADLVAAKALHQRCSADTLRARYHGVTQDTDRSLRRLLDPDTGHTLAARTASGVLVGLGHLLWDGDETEVALLVEDAWQGRGVGGELLGGLVALARASGRESVYAVTRTSNTAMVATMRGLGLPLDHRAEDGTLVVTARLTGPREGARPHGNRAATGSVRRPPSAAPDGPAVRPR
ncbi:GNAT family N-acetyltransferase [Streptomyces sp. JNUCC 64]